jgi:hypothetical protein
MSKHLALLFDLAKRHGNLVNFNGEYKPSHGKDLYSARGYPMRDVFAELEKAGLASSEVHADVTMYQLNDEARAALTES